MLSLFHTSQRKKLILMIAFILFSIGIIYCVCISFYGNSYYTIAVNSQISFSYPLDFSIKNVYASDPASAPYIQANNSKYKSFIDYKSPEDKFHFSYPSNFKLYQQAFPGSEILYHVDFQNKNDNFFTGFVQVWNLPYELSKFLEESKENSLSDFINFNSKEIEVNKMKGYFWEYTVKSSNENYKTLEVFLSKDSRMYRISFYLPEKNYTDEDYDMFWKMVNSIKVN
ncbi:hypothetical protein [Ruminiclostridium josui]|uniref:hypothetical protein n=2 Tax=Ruminiclostridium josui TaxID=1499 RepID=UPI0004634F6F|nr:hypothetical protein [Ruminiclostridium josui]